MFTGSTATGRTVAERAGRNLIGASMELGGKNAMIVLEDADLGRAVEGAERALFSNAGQLCISIERLFVHERIADEFTRRLTERVRAMKLSPALDYSADMGSLISRSQLETVTAHVDDAVAKGATVLAGGRARPDLGPYFYEPTLLEHTGEGMTLHRDETFGPVAAVARFSDTDEVDRARQRLRLRAELLALDARHRARPPSSPRACAPARSTSTRATPPPGRRSTRRWAG